MQLMKRHPRYLRGLSLLLLTGLLVLPYASLHAIDDMVLDIGDIVGDQWSISGLQIRLGQLSEDDATLQATLSSLDVSEQGRIVADASLVCAKVILGTDRFSCGEGQLQAGQTILGAQSVTLDIDYAAEDYWSLAIEGLSLARGVMSAGVSMRPEGWSLRAKGKQLLVEALPPLLQGILPVGWTISGQLNLEIALAGVQQQLNRVEIQLDGQALSYSDAAGLQVGEKLKAKARLKAIREAGLWQGTGALQLVEGQFYSDPWYMDVGDNALKFDFSGQWNPTEHLAKLTHYDLQLEDVVGAKGAAALTLDPLQLNSGTAKFISQDAGSLYRLLLQPLLIGSAMDALHISGKADGAIVLRAGNLYDLELQLQGVNMEDEREMFGFEDVNLNLDWSGTATVTSSSLSWRNGHIYNMQLGALDGQFVSSEDTLRLRSPVSIPLLGGKLNLRELHVGGLYAGIFAGHISASLDDLQLSALTQTLDWPEMEGKLQGDIPRIDLVPGHLLLGGTLRVGVFGGEMAVQNLSITDPFGIAPLFEADLRLRELDLGQLTQTFSFGRIEGGLEGEVERLQLVGWELSQFQMSLRSPPDDSRKHRISQRAIDNLTSLGNGVSGNLSNTFLRFFEDFSYSQIAMDISLSGDTAYMGGIDLADGGYYLVKGALLPRIDVIGRNRKIAWKELLQRIKEVQLEGAVIN